jgi:hypothetical protein
MASKPKRLVQLVGSVPLKSAEEVFRQTAGVLGALLPRIPDGETGERTNWIEWQMDRFAKTPGLQKGGQPGVEGARGLSKFRMKPGMKATEIAFGPLGYADEAIDSYAIFRRLRSSGSMPPGTRFQVSLPTALAVVFGFVEPDQVRELWPVYERRLFAELDEITSAIPHHDLAVQWDIAIEVCAILENPAIAKSWPIDTLVEPMVRGAMRVPPDVELGFHFCYGDPGHKHIVEPKDMGLMVDLANRLSAAVTRPINWMHMPVPRDRSDDDYFTPLRSLKLKSETTLFLGLVHLTDGLAGAQKRLAAAMRARAEFGIATECGFGRRSPETIPDLLALHREVASLSG